MPFFSFIYIMIKNSIFISFIFCFSVPGFSQLIEGDLLKDSRKIISDITHVIKPSNYDGKITFKISVNSEGTITAADILEERTTIVSTPAKIKAKNLVYNIKFEPGTYYPKFHTGIYQIIYKKN